MLLKKTFFVLFFTTTACVANFLCASGSDDFPEEPSFVSVSLATTSSREGGGGAPSVTSPSQDMLAREAALKDEAALTDSGELFGLITPVPPVDSDLDAISEEGEGCVASSFSDVRRDEETEAALKAAREMQIGDSEVQAAASAFPEESELSNRGRSMGAWNRKSSELQVQSGDDSRGLLHRQMSQDVEQEIEKLNAQKESLEQTRHVNEAIGIKNHHLDWDIGELDAKLDMFLEKQKSLAAKSKSSMPVLGEEGAAEVGDVSADNKASPSSLTLGSHAAASASEVPRRGRSMGAWTRSASEFHGDTGSGSRSLLHRHMSQATGERIRELKEKKESLEQTRRVNEALCMRDPEVEHDIATIDQELEAIAKKNLILEKEAGVSLSGALPSSTSSNPAVKHVGHAHEEGSTAKGQKASPDKKKEDHKHHNPFKKVSKFFSGK